MPALSFLIRSTKKQDACFVLLLITMHVAFYFSTGLYQCQYSFFEDHEIITTVAKIKHEGVAAALIEQMSYEMVGRFRPLYVIYRVGTCAFLGDNIQRHHVLFYLVFVVNTLLLFYWGRKFGFSTLLSFFFTLLAFAGFQSNVGWRLSNGENFALLFLNAALLCFSVNFNRQQWWLSIMAGVLMLLAAFSKESFISCFAFFPLLFLRKYYSQPVPWEKLWLLTGTVILAIGLYVLSIRFLLVNPDAMKYAGNSVSIKDILELQFGIYADQNYAVNFSRIWQTLIFQGSYFQPYLLLLALISVCGFIFLPFRKTILLSLGVVLVILIFHKLLYLRVLLSNIYMYPGMLVIGFVIVSLIHQLFIQSKKIVTGGVLVVVLFVVINQGKNSYTSAKEFYSENLAAISVTDTLISHCLNNPIYIQADPLLHVEFVYGIKTRLKSLGCTNPILFYPLEEGDSAEALSIMKHTDPSIIPFLRKQFYKQFSKWIIPEKPEATLDGKNIWVIIQRPERHAPKFKEVESGQYVQYFYKAPQFYTISALVPTESN